MSAIKDIQVETVLPGRLNNQCWFAPHMAVVNPDDAGGPPEVFVGVSQITANDCGALHWTRTRDLGKRWTPPMESLNLTGVPHPDHFFEMPNINAFYHRASRRLLGLGRTVFVRDIGASPQFKMTSRDHEHTRALPFRTVMTEWDFENGDFQPWHEIKFDGEFDFLTQLDIGRPQYEFPDGLLLAPFYLPRPADGSKAHTRVMLAEVTAGGMLCRRVGQPVKCADGYLVEPAVVRFGGRFLLTLRHPERAYVAVSEDGLDYDEPRPWLFDDGAELGNYNTQQHWLAHGDDLYLVYNRRSELNNGVFRSRAPLFIARVDTERLCVIRDSEKIVFPEKGARMGNFAVANVTADEAWVITGEWLSRVVPDAEPGERFVRFDLDQPIRTQYIGDLLLGRIRF